MTKSELRTTLASNTKHIRKGLSMNQKQFSEFTGIGRSNLAAIEEERSLSIELALKICEKTNISLDTIFRTKM